MRLTFSDVAVVELLAGSFIFLVFLLFGFFLLRFFCFQSFLRIELCFHFLGLLVDLSEGRWSN